MQDRNQCVIDIPTIRRLLGLGLATAIIYAIFSYGGIRSPDSEVEFRTAEALATHHGFAVTHRLPRLDGFGLPIGKDGQYYSLFGPGQPLASVPLVKLAMVLDKTGWYQNVPQFIPVSFYVGDGLFSFVRGEVPPDLEAHAVRFLVCLFNIIVGSLSVCFFFLLAKLLTQSDCAAWITSILFAFGSLMMPYCGTFFSEPLATFFVILSLYCIVWNDLTDQASKNTRLFSLFSSGVFLGMATTVHISSLLFAPFFFGYGTYAFLKTKKSLGSFLVSATIFSAGLVVFLLLLGYFNYARFGNIFETGRTAVASIDYADFVPPWKGLLGLIFSSGKGIVWYCPAAVVSCFFWRPFHRRFPALSWTILGSVLLRLLFIASRSDWHGGFSLGPRYLVMAIPLMILPLSESLAEWIHNRDIRTLWLFFPLVFGCIIQQIYFSLGEVFSFYHMINWTFRGRGINVFQNDALYLEWDKSPLLHLLQAFQGPSLLRLFHWSNGTLFCVCVGLGGALMILEYARSLRKQIGRWH